MIRIGNAQAFWGDSPNAAARMVHLEPELDYVTLDYLAELSLSIMAAQREKDPKAGYARDFVDVVHSLVPYWNEGAHVRVVTNAGGLNPQGCAEACAAALKAARRPLKIGIVDGDDVLSLLKNDPDDPLYTNLDTGQTLRSMDSALVTANAYLGARPIAQALELGADIVITGRVADPSLTVGPCAFHFQWAWNAYDKLAGATIAGHLIECGTQATGGMSTNWSSILDPVNLGFPIVEMNEDGSFVITKPAYTGGRVNEETIKEQLLYEIGNPQCYLSPDVTVSFLGLNLNSEGKDRIHISGAKGFSPTDSYKVSASYRDGFKAEAFLGIYGPDAAEKARKCGEIIIERVRHAGYALHRTHIECLGNGDIVPGVKKNPSPLMECVLRIAVADPRREALDCFAKEIAPLVASGPQGVTGYASGRPHIREVFGFWPCLIQKSSVAPRVKLLEAL